MNSIGKLPALTQQEFEDYVDRRTNEINELVKSDKGPQTNLSEKMVNGTIRNYEINIVGKDLSQVDIYTRCNSRIRYEMCRMGDIAPPEGKRVVYIGKIFMARCTIERFHLTRYDASSTLLGCNIASICLRDCDGDVDLYNCDIGSVTTHNSPINVSISESDISSLHITGSEYGSLSAEQSFLGDVHLSGNKFTHLSFETCTGPQMYSISTLKWEVQGFLDYLQVGCQFHTLENWKKLTDTHLENIPDDDAKPFWDRYGHMIITLAEISAGQSRTKEKVTDQIDGFNLNDDYWMKTWGKGNER